MIVSSTPFGARLVTQSDHARLAADMLRLFRIPELLEHPRREALLRAVAEHDNGWWEADAAPRLDERGQVLDFRAFPSDLRQEIWWRGVERFAGERPYAAALIATHALRLVRRLADEASWRAFSADLERRRSELLEAAGENLAALAMDDPWLEVADNLSLAVATGDAGFVKMAGWRAEVAGSPGGPELGVEPFHLAGATSFELSCRWLETSKFASAEALARRLASATWARIAVRVRPL